MKEIFELMLIWLPMHFFGNVGRRIVVYIYKRGWNLTKTIAKEHVPKFITNFYIPTAIIMAIMLIIEFIFAVWFGQSTVFKDYIFHNKTTRTLGMTHQDAMLLYGSGFSIAFIFNILSIWRKSKVEIWGYSIDGATYITRSALSEEGECGSDKV